MATRSTLSSSGKFFSIEHSYTFGNAEFVGPMTTIYSGVWNYFDRDVHIASAEGLVGLKPTTRTMNRVFTSVADEAGRVQGPNLPDIIDSSRLDKKTAVVVMRLPPGMVLSRYIEERGVLDIDQCYQVLRGVSRALAACREQASPHRGATPDRIWLCDDGTPILLGYGEALRRREINNLTGRTAKELWWHLPPEVLRDAGDGDGTPDDASVVRTIVGTEQLPELEDSEAAEVWNLGCLAYYCLEGHHPYFAKPNDHQHGIVNALQDIRLPLHREVSYLQPVIDRALHSDPTQRFANTRELVTTVYAITHPGADEHSGETSPQRVLPGMPTPAVQRPSVETEQTLKRMRTQSALWRTSAVALFIALLMYAWLDTRRPRSLLLTSDPIGIEIVETTGHLDTSRGRTPIILSERRLNDPLTLRTVGPSGHLGEPVTVLPSAFSDLGRCAHAEIIPTFAPARPTPADESAAEETAEGAAAANDDIDGTVDGAPEAPAPSDSEELP